MKFGIMCGVALGVMAAGCTSEPQVDDAAAGTNRADAAAEAGETVRAELRDPEGTTLARATLSQEGGGVRLVLAAAGLPAGTYGAHIHMTGRCDAPDFASAGDHWNPTHRQHGRDNPQGAHMGDLPNLTVAADGTGEVSFDIAGATLRGSDGDAVLDADGAAVIVHAGPDDYRTDPSGNSGARIACGVIG